MLKDTNTLNNNYIEAKLYYVGSPKKFTLQSFRCCCVRELTIYVKLQRIPQLATMDNYLLLPKRFVLLQINQTLPSQFEILIRLFNVIWKSNDIESLIFSLIFDFQHKNSLYKFFVFSLYSYQNLHLLIKNVFSLYIQMSVLRSHQKVCNQKKKFESISVNLKFYFVKSKS